MALSETPVPAASGLAPVALQERVPLYDVLRGFCLFGVLWSNLNDWYTVAKPATPLDNALRWTQDWLLEGRFYSMLGFLFGIGFAIQLTRAAQRGHDVRNLFLRRMAALLGIGLVHAMLIWHGDILIVYALAGLLLVLFRRSSTRMLPLAALALCLLFPYIVFHASAGFNLQLPRYDRTWQQSNEQAFEVYAHGTWTQVVALGPRKYSGWLVRELLLGGTSRFLALFLLGLWAVRVDLLARLTRRRTNIAWALVGAVVGWVGLQYALLHTSYWWPAPPVSAVATWRNLRFWWPPRGVVISFLDHVATWSNSATYALVFALAMSFAAAAKRLQPLAAVGRMTLTTYLTQSVVCTVFFYHWGFGLMNKTNLTGLLLVTVLLFLVQVLLSVWWLNRYRFGPAEWLWRTLAYGRKLPLRRTSASPAGPVSAAATA